MARAINGRSLPDRRDFSLLTGTRGGGRDWWRGFTRATAAVEFTRGTTAAEGRERASEVDERATTLHRLLVTSSPSLVARLFVLHLLLIFLLHLYRLLLSLLFVSLFLMFSTPSEILISLS